jgi:hypothetical protein
MKKLLICLSISLLMISCESNLRNSEGDIILKKGSTTILGPTIDYIIFK